MASRNPASRKPGVGSTKRAAAGARPNALATALSPDDTTLRAFMADFHAAIAVMRVLRQHIAATIDLASAEWSILLAVWSLEPHGSVTIRAIADHLHVAAAHVTAEVGKLVERGLLTKAPHPTDGRSVGISLTNSARELFRTAGPMLREINQHLLADVLYRDMIAVQRFFRNIIDHGADAVRITQDYMPRNDKNKAVRGLPRLR